MYRDSIGTRFTSGIYGLYMYRGWFIGEFVHKTLAYIDGLYGVIFRLLPVFILSQGEEPGLHR